MKLTNSDDLLVEQHVGLTIEHGVYRRHLLDLIVVEKDPVVAVV